MNITFALDSATQQLSQSSDSARLDAEVLLAHSLSQPRSYLHTWPEKVLNSEQEQVFLSLIQKRCNGEPIAYLIGYREFWDIRLHVNEHTLIPRPETELLVELALERIPLISHLRIADLGTGSGAIALAIAKHRPESRIVATDISEHALTLAQRNATDLNIDNVHFIQSDWFSALDNDPFDIIVSNPPYVEEADPHLNQGDLRFEPQSALSSGVDGLDAIRNIILNAAAHLSSQGWLFLEHGFDQALSVRKLLIDQGFINVQSKRDLAKIDRVTLGQLS